jgi:hypothetical protein
MTSLCYLASYPRSGNTFVRILLANYLSGRDSPVRLADLPWLARGEHISGLWLALTGAPAAARTLEQEWRARPAYFERLRADAASDLVLVKTHTVNGVVCGLPAFHLRDADRAVYIVRHPGDVALSWASFYGKSVEAAIDDLLSPGRYLRGLPHSGYELTGSWGQHVESWTRETEPLPLVVDYRNLCGDPAGELGRVVRFLGLPVSPERLATAAAFSGFERLQRDEAEHGFAEGPEHGRFFRVGRPDQWREAMSRAQIARLYAAYGELIDRLGLDMAPTSPSPSPSGNPQELRTTAGTF